MRRHWWPSLGDRAHLRMIAKSSRPILVGPWRSEVGFEVLYWLPWLHAWRERWKIAKDRLIVLSRGGAGAWYDAAQAIDLYDYLPVAQLRKAMLHDAATTGSVKQRGITDWEGTVCTLVAQQLGLRRYHILHPSLMYRALTPWWEGRMGAAELLTRLRFALVPAPAPPLTLALPERFVAVGFYARHTWPLTDETLEWGQHIVTTLSARINVVLVGSTLRADEHLPFPLVPGTSSHSALPAASDLALQSAILAKSQAFVGTYGGLMQLAVRLGKPAAGFYTKFEGTAYAHKHLTEWLGVQQQTPVFIGRPDDLRFLGDILHPGGTK